MLSIGMVQEIIVCSNWIKPISQTTPPLLQLFIKIMMQQKLMKCVLKN